LAKKFRDESNHYQMVARRLEIENKELDNKNKELEAMQCLQDYYENGANVLDDTDDDDDDEDDDDGGGSAGGLPSENCFGRIIAKINPDLHRNDNRDGMDLEYFCKLLKETDSMGCYDHYFINVMWKNIDQMKRELDHESGKLLTNNMTAKRKSKVDNTFFKAMALFNFALGDLFTKVLDDAKGVFSIFTLYRPTT